MAASQEIALRTSKDVESLNELDKILLTGELQAEVIDDPDEISRNIIAQLLAAESDEELNGFGDAVGWREFAVPKSMASEGTPMRLHGFQWRPSSYEEGAPIYFIVQATDVKSNVRRTLTTGSLNVLAQLSNMARRGTLEGSVWTLVTADKPTARGFKPLALVRSFDTEADAVDVEDGEYEEVASK